MVQVTDKSKRLSKQQASDLVDKEHNNDIRRSVKRSNLVRQQEFKKMKKNQKRTGKKYFLFSNNFELLFILIRKIRLESW
jgi:hypothetical protein